MNPKKRSLKRILLNVSIFSAVIVGIGLFLWLRPKKTITIRYATVTMGSITDRVSSSVAGDILADKSATVRSQISGSVIAIYKEVGQAVKKGDLIVQFDDADVKAQLKQSDAAIRSARAQVSQSQARINSVSFQAKTIENLFQGSAATERERTDSKNSLLEAMASKHVSSSQVSQSRAAKFISEVTLSKTQLRAPFDGILTSIPIHVGDSLVMGNPVFDIVDDEKLHLEATLDEADSAKVKIGQDASLSVYALPHIEIKGHVSRIDPIVKKDAKGARILLVEIEIDKLSDAKQKGLKAGMSANVEIVVSKKEQVLYLPSSVIIGRGVNQSVYLLQKESPGLYKVKKWAIKTGISNWEVTEVSAFSKEAPLKQGDLVVSSLNEKGLEDEVLVKLEQDASQKQQVR